MPYTNATQAPPSRLELITASNEIDERFVYKRIWQKSAGGVRQIIGSPYISASADHNEDQIDSMQDIDLSQVFHNRKLTFGPMWLRRWYWLHRNDSLFLFSSEGFVRRSAIRVVNHSAFNWIVFLFVLLNFIIIALEDPAGSDDIFFEVAEVVFLAIFLLEAVLKIITLGFIYGKSSYLRDPWNWLDFTIVVTGVVTISLDTGTQVTFLRTFRTLRFLRTISLFGGLRVLVESLLQSLPLLVDALILVAIMFFIFCVIGIFFFGGGLGWRCVDDLGNAVEEIQFSCGVRTCPNGLSCRKLDDGINTGYSSFDDIALSWLTIYQITSLEGWSDILYHLSDSTVGVSEIGWLYFLVLIFVGVFFLMNLILAILKSNYGKSLAIDNIEDAATADDDRTPRSERSEESDDSGMNSHRDSENDGGTPMSMGGLDGLRLSHIVRRESDVESLDSHKYSYISAQLQHLQEPRRYRQWVSRVRGACKRLGQRQIIALEPYVASRTFEHTVVVLIFLNTVFLSITHADQADIVTDVTYWANVVLSSLFFLEMVLKMAAMGLTKYLEDGFNFFDAFVSFTSIVDVIVSGGSGVTAVRVVRVFRLLRVLRVVRLARYFQSLRNLVEVFTRSVKHVGYFAILLFLLMLIYALLGVQLFSGTYPPDERTNFDNFGNALLSLFQIMTGEDWNGVMYNAMDGTSWAAAFYFLSWYTITVYILLDLFLAILLENFQAIFEEEEEEGITAKAAKAMSVKERVEAELGGPRQAQSTTSVGSDTVLFGPMAGLGTGVGVVSENNSTPSSSTSSGSMSTSESSQPHVRFSATQVPEVERQETTSSFSFAPTWLRDLDKKDRSCGLFPPDLRFRLFCSAIVNNDYFEGLVLLAIAGSSLALAFENPGQSEDAETLLQGFDFFFSAVFFCEMLLKVIAKGFVLHRESYLRDSWNRIDFIIVVGSIASLVLFVSGSDAVKEIRVFRLLRALRPLRAVKRNAGMQTVVNALLGALGAIANAVVVIFFVWLVFAIMGVVLYAGRFRSCNDHSVHHKDECVGTFTLHGVATERAWTNEDANFDNLIISFLTLFVISTTEGWVDIMYSAIDAPEEVNFQPQMDRNRFHAFFFILFIIVGSFFTINLFVGVVFDHFWRQRAKYKGSALLTDKQRQWVDAKKAVAEAEAPPLPQAPNNRFRALCHRLVLNPAFGIFIVVTIVLNVISTGFVHHNMSPEFDDAMGIVQLVFSSIFIFEAIVKILGMGWKVYLSSNWNRFDFLLALLSAADIIGTRVVDVVEQSSTSVVFLTRLARLFRISRLFRLIRGAQGMRKVLWTLVYSLPSLMNIGSLLFLLFFMFAVLGISLFGEVEWVEGGALNDHANFRTFGMAMLTLFRVSTGEGWESIMFECTHNDGGTYFAPIYFVVFLVLTVFVMLNLFIAIIAENFDTIDSVLVTGSQRFSDNDLNDFNDVWCELDHQADQFIPVSKIDKLFRALDPPFGVDDGTNDIHIWKRFGKLDIPLYSREGYDELVVFHTEVLFALAASVYQSDLPPVEQLEDIDQQLKRKTRKKTKKNNAIGRRGSVPINTALLEAEEDELYTSKHWAAAKLIQQHYRLAHRSDKTAAVKAELVLNFWPKFTGLKPRVTRMARMARAIMQ